MGRAERSEGNVKAASDIDQTLAGGIIRAHMMFYNPLLDLRMTQEAIDALETTPGIRKTFDVPEIIDFRAKGQDAEDEFQRVRSLVRTSKEVHANLRPEPGSTEGIQILRDRYGNMHYYSVRPHAVGDTTVDWLEINNYPEHKETVICNSHQDKLVRIAKDFVLVRGDSGVNMNEDVKAVILDDSYKELADAAENLASRYAVMRRALSGIIVVAFRASEGQVHKTERSGLRFVNQPNWDKSSVEQTIREVDLLVAT